MFDYFDPYAQVTRELSSISKRDGRLEGHAEGSDYGRIESGSYYWGGYFGRTDGHILSLGAGGSALATLLHLINKPNKADRPDKFVAINRSADRLEHMRNMVAKYETDIEVNHIQSNDPACNDKVMARMPEYSIIINATGMGKDTPGSPITDNGLFPRSNSIAWSLTYRGELDFAPGVASNRFA